MPNGSMIPFTGLNRQYANLKEELLDVIDSVYSSGQVLDGPYTRAFETEIATRTNRDCAVAVNSCSQALLITYLYYSSQENKNKNVALPALSFIASAGAPTLTNRNITFVDVDENGLLDINKLAIREDNINIVSYVNLYGNLIDYDKLKIAVDFFNDDKIFILEDAAQSFGAYYKGIPSGKLGHASCLSFDPTKNLPNYGSGGMILTDDPELMHFAYNFRDNGKSSDFETLGSNSKMSESDCAQMGVKLKYFDEWQARRSKIAEFYNDCLSLYVVTPEVTPECTHAWHKYVIKTVDRATMSADLRHNGIETKVHYNQIMPDIDAFRLGVANWPVAEELTRTSLSLPIYPEMTDAEVEHVVDTIQKFYD